MQSKIKIKCCKECPVEGTIGFCNTCKEVFCKKCVCNHIGHKTTKMKSFYEGRKKSILSQVSMSELSSQLEERRDGITEICNMLHKDINKIERAIRTKKNIVENSQENFELEIGRIETVTKYLNKLKEKSVTIALKNACEEAMKCFDIEEEIRKEFETLDKNLAVSKRIVKEMKKGMRDLKKEIRALNYFTEDENYEFDDEKWSTFIILNEKTPLFTPPEYRINTTIDKFKAFPSVENVFDIEEVMKKKLINVGQNVKITEPIKVKKGLIAGDLVSLSHNGVLAICFDDSGKKNNHKYTLQFTDLNTDKQVSMNVEGKSLAGFYDSMILLLTNGKPLRETTVKEIFDNSTIETFKKIKGTSNVPANTDVSLLHEKRELYYSTKSNKLFFFNVDTRINTEIDVGMKVGNIAFFSGIDCGVKTIFYSLDDKCTYSLNNDNSVTKVYEKQFYYLTALFPSTSNPNNIKDAMFKYRGLIRCGNNINIRKLIDFGWNYPVVRIYEDIFLAYDWNTKSWVLVRILIP